MGRQKDNKGRSITWMLPTNDWWFSQSQMAEFQACRFRWWLRYVLGLEPVITASALSLGSLWHLAQHYLWMSQDWNDDSAKQAMVSALLDRIDMNKETSAEEKAEIVKVESMLERYVSKWGEPYGLVVGSEVEIEVYPIRGQGKLWEWYNKSTKIKARVKGRLDKITVVNGEAWVVEHKTTSLDLQDWRTKNDYAPQAAIYCWLLMTGWQQVALRESLSTQLESVRRAMENSVGGIVYDLASTQAPATVEDCELLKAGALSKRLPRMLSLDVFNEAAEKSGKELDWYEEKRNELRANPPKLFSRYTKRLGIDEVSRTMAEVSSLATEARRVWRQAQKDIQSECLSRVSYTRSELARHIQELGHKYPRCAGACWSYNRRCQFMDVCQYASADALEEFDVPRDK